MPKAPSAITPTGQFVFVRVAAWVLAERRLPISFARLLLRIVHRLRRMRGRLAPPMANRVRTDFLAVRAACRRNAKMGFGRGKWPSRVRIEMRAYVQKRTMGLREDPSPVYMHIGLPRVD